MSNTLLPCPFCSAPAKVKRNKTVMVSCTGCSASTFQVLDDPDSAIAAWNRRASTSKDSAINALKQIAEIIVGGEPHGAHAAIADAYSMRDIARAALAAASTSQEPAQAQDAIRELITIHGDMLEANPYCYFELAYTRYTGWMAWLCSNQREKDPNRKVLAQGQGDTPEEACNAAIAAMKKEAADAGDRKEEDDSPYCPH